MWKQKVKQISHHRNGVSGIPFYVAIVNEKDNEGEEREMLVIRFDSFADEQTGGVVCAAFDMALLDKREINFGTNSWRGDYYHEVIDATVTRKGKIHDKR